MSYPFCGTRRGFKQDVSQGPGNIDGGKPDRSQRSTKKDAAKRGGGMNVPAEKRRKSNKVANFPIKILVNSPIKIIPK